MKPLPRENTIWEFLRAHIFMIFRTCFTVSSRIHILRIFFFVLLGGSHLEKGGTGRHLGGIWEASRRHLGGKGPEEAQRRLALKKLIDICSQKQKLHLFFNLTMRF